MTILNRRARFDYEIIEEYEAGIILTGPEVKSLRAGQANLTESHCIERDGRIYLIGCHISPYKPAYTMNPDDPARTRELLLHKEETRRLIGKLKERGLTLIALSIYFTARRYCKIKLALARGKKLHDKRETIKEREVKRDLDRQYKMRG